LKDVGSGMLAVVAGPTLAAQLGLAADDTRPEKPGLPAEALTRLADLLQQTHPGRLLPLLTAELKKGTSLRQLVAAGALANARAFGGQNYDGYHTFMALGPAFHMASRLPEKEQPLPVLKVLHRNSRVTHGAKCHEAHALAEVKPAELKKGAAPREQLRDAGRRKSIEEAERVFAAMKGPRAELFDDLQLMVQDDLNVHRVVLAWRAWETADFTGESHARSLLRQTVRFCSDPGQSGRDHPIREELPRLLENHKLLEKKPGARKADNAWVEKLANTIHTGTRRQAAEAAASALADGIDPAAIAEAISLASTFLVLHDPGRPKDWASAAKPVGSVHGDSVGVHASDAANAWRHIAAVSSPRNTFASLIASAYHTAGQAGRNMKSPYPLPADVEAVDDRGAASLLGALDEAVRGGDQRRATAVASKYGKEGHPAKDLLAALLKSSISEDGALHAEKYFQTATEEFARGREAFRWLHLVALARVTASSAGHPAPGVAEARKLLGV
jgi:hypothetical protein